MQGGGKMKQNNLQALILSALFTAFIAIFSQVTIPLPLIPMTGQTFAVALAATILGKKYGTISVLLYILIGAVGMPVYAQMLSGPGILFGPTGGYLFSFIAVAYIIGWYLEKKPFTFMNAMIANMIGVVINLAIGTIWLKYYGSYSWGAAISAGAVPFIIVGILKGALASYLGYEIKKRLARARLLPA